MTEHQGFAVPTLPAPTGSPLSPPAASPLVAPVPAGADPTVAPLPIPTLPPVGGSVTTTAVAPVAELAGAPIEPAGFTPTPQWKKRKKSPVRKLFKTVTVLAVLGGIGFGGYLGYQKLAPESAPTAALPLDDPDTLIGRSNQLTIEINENVEEAIVLGELGLDPLGDAIDPLAGGVQSYDFVWSSETFINLRVSSDMTSGDFTLTDGSLSIRRVGQQVFTQSSPLAPWEVTPSTAAVPPAVLAGPLEVDNVITNAITPWTIGPATAPGGLVTYTIDESAMFAEAPEVWSAYITNWGHVAAAEPVAPTRDMLVTMQIDPSGQLVMVTLDSRSLGGVSTYTLMTMSGAPLVVEAPAGP